MVKTLFVFLAAKSAATQPPMSTIFVSALVQEPRTPKTASALPLAPQDLMQIPSPINVQPPAQTAVMETPQPIIV